MQKKYILVSGATLLLAVLIGGAYILNKKTGSIAVTRWPSYNTVEEAVASQKSLVCKYEQHLSGVTNTSTFYISPGYVKEEITTAIAKEYVLITPTFTYLWNDLSASVATVPANIAKQSNTILLRTPIRTHTCIEMPLQKEIFTAPHSK
jgi:hypothetical protein